VLRFIKESRSESVVDLYHIMAVNGHMERFGVRRIVADLGKFLRCKVGVQLIEWCIPPTVRRNIHAEVMTEYLVQSPLIFIFEAVDAQFTGLFPLWAPVRHIDLGITAFEFTRPLSTGAKTLPHVHHDTHLLCGDAFRILEFTFTSDTSFFS
jgi:hypothetical protein